MKRRFLNTLLIMSLCSFVLAGCGSSAPTNEPENTETTIAVEPETTPTPEAEPETAEETKEIEEVETETAETTETETQTEEAEVDESSAYTFTDMDATKYAKSSANVRSLPDTSGDKLGGLSTNDEVHITGQCNETDWFRFEYNGSVAYVSNSYLVDEKVAVEQAPANNGGGNTSAKHTPESDGYPVDVWVDMGTYAFKVVSQPYNASGQIPFDAEDRSWGDAKAPGRGVGGQFLNDGSGRMCKIAFPIGMEYSETVCYQWTK